MKWITSLFKKDNEKKVGLDNNHIQESKPRYGTNSTVEDDELYEATFQSNDIERKIRATELKTDDIITRHFLLQSIISESYKVRQEEYYSNLCVKFFEMHLKEFDKIANAFRSKDGSIPRVLVFQNYATLLTELGQFEKAVKVCEMAISFGLDDGTKGNYQGRIDKIKKKNIK